MKRSIRLTLLFVSLLLFATVAPFIVFYAIGYRLSPREIRATPVGVLLLETIPRRADVEVNGTFIGRTPRAVPNLEPGVTKVTLHRDSYANWEKNITVEPTLTTEFRHIRLFPNNPTQTVIASSTQLFSLSPQEKQIAVVDGKHMLQVLDITGRSLLSAVPIGFVPQTMSWSPDSTMLVLANSSRAALLDLAAAVPRIENLAGITTRNSIGWDPQRHGVFWFRNSKGEVASIATLTRQVTPLAPLSVAALGPQSVVGVTSAGTIEEYALNGQHEKTIMTKVSQTVKTLKISSQGAIAALFTNGSVAILKDNGLQPVVDHALDLTWSPDGSILALQTASNELHVYNVSHEYLPSLEIGTRQLVTRLSRPLTGLTWFGGPYHMLYQVDDELSISETDTRDHPITYTVDTTNTGNSQAVAVSDGSAVYYLKKGKSTTSLLRIQLSVEN